jgi:hypothetical protein
VIPPGAAVAAVALKHLRMYPLGSRPLAKVKLTQSPDTEEILLPLRFGEDWGGVSSIYARGLVTPIRSIRL